MAKSKKENKMTMKKIYYVDALASAGKTYQALNYAVRCAHFDQQKTVIILKSKQLMDEAFKTAKSFKHGLRSLAEVTAINSDNLGTDENGKSHGSVKAAILDHLKQCDIRLGEVLLITEAAFLQLPYWPKRWAWHCICDEIPNVTNAHVLNVADHYDMLTKHLKLSSATTSFSQVHAKGNSSVLKSYASNSNFDDINGYFQELSQEVLSDHYDVFANTSNYARILNKDSVKGTIQLQFFSILKPTIFGSGKPIGDDEYEDIFKSITIMGACFPDSQLYYLWPKDGVVFEEHGCIGDELRFKTHTCGPRMSIKYVFEQNWSKRKRDQTQQVGRDNLSSLDILLAAIEDEFGDDEFIYMVNKDVETEVNAILGKLNGKQLQNSPYGLNCYQHIHKAVVLSALNTIPAHYAFLKEMGIDGEAAREALYHQVCYQAIMRTSLRDKNATDHVTVIVSDKSAALSLQELFPGAHVSSMIKGIKEPERRRVGRPKLSSTKPRAVTDRQNYARSRRIKQMILDVQAGKAIDTDEFARIEQKTRPDNKDFFQLKLLIKRGFSWNSNKNNLLSGAANQLKSEYIIHVPVFASIFSSKPNATIPIDIRDVDGFMAMLKQTSQTAISDKRYNSLLSTTEFDSDLSDNTNRGLENITRIWGIWLDIDGGDMPRTQIPKLFADIKMAVFNSYSMGNYRIFIPTTQIMSIGEYQRMMQIILEKVQSTAPDDELLEARATNRRPRNYVSEAKARQQSQRGQVANPVHGIDLSKLTPSSIFYMPSQCGDDPDASFFDKYMGDDRHVLDHNEWLSTYAFDNDEIEEIILHEEKLEMQNKQTQLDQHPLIEHEQHSTHVIPNNIIPFNRDAIIDKAIAEYAAIPDGLGRHEGFFKAMYHIHHKAGIPLNQLEPYMRQCDYDGHQSKKYKSIIASLSKPRYQPKRARLGN